MSELPERDRRILEHEAKHARVTIEHVVLRIIAQGSGAFGPTEYFWSFRNIMAETGLSREYVRAACRSLTDQGYAEYSSMLSDEDGNFRGAGYSATKAGIEYLDQMGNKT